MPGLTQRRCYHESVAMGNKLYVIGGLKLQTCEVFDGFSNKFTAIRQFPKKIPFDMGVEMFRIKNEIVVKFCNRKDAEEDDVFIYNTTTDEWTSICVNTFKGPERSLIINKQ